MENQLQTSSVSNQSLEKILRHECFLVVLVRNAVSGEFPLVFQHQVVNQITSRGKVQHVLLLLLQAILLASLSIFIVVNTNLCLNQRFWVCRGSAVSLLSGQMQLNIWKHFPKAQQTCLYSSDPKASQLVNMLQYLYFSSWWSFAEPKVSSGSPVQYLVFQILIWEKSLLRNNQCFMLPQVKHLLFESAGYKSPMLRKQGDH